MIRFECDYGEGAAQPVLDLLQKTNLEQTPGYGMDDYCDQARGLIRKLCDAPDAGVHFFVGATQANFTVVDALLKPWQGVLCADSGHINVHETGAVEATGHKCLALPSVQGKITAQQVRDLTTLTGPMPATSTLPSPAWCISPTPLRTAPCTPRRS